MNIVSIGDLATSLMMRGQNARLKTEMNVLTAELASGQISDLSGAFRGDFRELSSIEATLSRLETYSLVNSETAGFAETMQISLTAVQETATDIGADLLSAGSLGMSMKAEALGASAVESFKTTVAKLNTQYAGRYLFSGMATDTAPLADAEDMLNDIATTVSGLTSASDVIAAVENWFDAAGGSFETIGYTGSANSLASMQTGPNTTVDLDTTASDTAIRETLKGLALAAMIEMGPFSGDALRQSYLASASGEMLVNAADQVVDLQAGIGSAQEAIEVAATSIAAEASAMEIARTGLLEADAYNTATELQTVETQLQLLYALTARSANMSLVNYL